MNAPDFMIITSTVDSEDSASRLASLLVDRKLAACVQYFPIKSIYRWKDNIETSSEHLISAKTRTEKVPEAIEFIKENHSYDVPEIITTPIVSGHQSYLDWIKEETT